MNRFVLIIGLGLTAYNAWALVGAGSWLLAVLAVLYTAGFLFDASSYRDSNPQLARQLVVVVLTSQLAWLVTAQVAESRAECQAALVEQPTEVRP